MAGSNDGDQSGSAAGSGGHYGYHGHHHRGGGRPIGSHDVTDPVCGMLIDPHMTEHYLDWNGTRVHFCSSECQSKFAADPDQYR